MRTRAPLDTIPFLVALTAACTQTTSDGARRESSSSIVSPSGPSPQVAPAAEACSTPVAPTQCAPSDGGKPYSTYKWPLFGNLHQHTQSSLDAYSFGTRATSADAYEFAKGNLSIQIGAATSDPPGPVVPQLQQPLDFLAVTNHSEWLGIVSGCNDKSNSMYGTQDCKNVRQTNAVIQASVFASMPQYYSALCGTGSTTSAQCIAAQRTAWQDDQCAAANEYVPCQFTTFVAFEWTGMNGTASVHRNVIFGNDNVPTNPLDSYTYPTPYNTDGTGLFNALDTQCTGDCAALVVAHNTNQSDGQQLTLPQSPGELDAMTRYQKLVEIYQHKGSSECFDDTGPSALDPYCAFEYLHPGGANDLKSDYVRTALESGLQYASDNAAANPLALGHIASVDDHNATAGWVDEDKYDGHIGRMDDTAQKRLDKFSDYGPGGLAVVWAEQNTRDSIFAALTRRETYGTSGPRMIVRFYQTSYAGPCTADFPNTIIDAGAALPMGGTFGSASLPPGAAPTFAIGAWPDLGTPQPLADGTTGVAGLAAIHVIKAHYKAGDASVVEDAPVVLSLDPMGQCLTWTDTSYDASEYAFYYVRVLQVPTWRWSHFDCQAAPNTNGCQGGNLDVTIQERAWTSPIWATP
jgi:hypothetical protein